MRSQVQLSNKKIQFKPTFLPTLAALAMIVLTLYLSNWQTSRAAQKAEWQAIYDARATLVPINLNDALRTGQSEVNIQLLRYRRGLISGQWLVDAQFVVDNKQQNSAPGYHVITPLRLVDSAQSDKSVEPTTPNEAITANQNANARETVILVNRGWVPRTRNYPALPAIAPPPQMDRYIGLLVAPSKKYLELGAGSNVAPSATSAAVPTAATTAAPTANAANAPQKAKPPKPLVNEVWQNLDVDRVAAANGLNLFPLVMLLNSDAPAANTNTPPLTTTNTVFTPIEQIETPDAGVDKHRGYAFQWLALAIAILIVWLVVNTKISNTIPAKTYQ